MNTNKIEYSSPSMKTLELAPVKMICISGNSGTEKVGVSTNNYGDSDFE
ncbi:MAG: hypothetical protein J5871_02900 [Bacteroidales bacterium]|nr:hypothetical protein [Bacteroidales bacterium]